MHDYLNLACIFYILSLHSLLLDVGCYNHGRVLYCYSDSDIFLRDIVNFMS